MMFFLKNKKKRIILIIAGLVIITLAIIGSACLKKPVNTPTGLEESANNISSNKSSIINETSSTGSDASSSSSSSNSTIPTKSTQLNYMTWYMTNDIKADDRIVKYLEDKFDVDIVFKTYARGDAYTSAMKKMALSGDLPDIMKYDSSEYKLIDMNANKQIASIDSLVTAKNYPTLRKYLDEAKKTINLKEYNNKIPFIPMRGWNYYHSLYVRQDWLDKLNLKAPTTLEQLYAVANSFAQKNLGGTDASGLTTGGLWWTYHLVASFTDSWEFTVNNNKAVPNFALPDIEKYLGWLQKMYKSSALDNDVIENTAAIARQKFIDGKAGFLIGECQPTNYNSLKKSIEDKGGKIAVIKMPGLTKSNGHQISATPFGTECSIISAKSKAINKALQLFEYIATPEGDDLMTYGIEGIHYTVSGNKKVMNRAEMAKDGFGIVGQIQHSMINYLKYDNAISPDLENYEENLTIHNNLYRWGLDGYFTYMNPILSVYDTDARWGLPGGDKLKDYYDYRDKWHIESLKGVITVDAASMARFREEFNTLGFNTLVDEMTSYYKEKAK
jgi:hypothetical protein